VGPLVFNDTLFVFTSVGKVVYFPEKQNKNK